MQSPGPPGWSVSRSSSGGLFAFAPQVDHRHQGWRHGDVDVDASEWKNQQHEYSTRRRAPTACDMCRRRKIKCELEGSANVCVQCTQRKTRAQHVRYLETRLKQLESLLRTAGVLPQDYINEEHSRQDDEELLDYEDENDSDDDDDDDDEQKTVTPNSSTSSHSETKRNEDSPAPHLSLLKSWLEGEPRYFGHASSLSILSQEGIQWIREKSGETDFPNTLLSQPCWQTRPGGQWRPDVFHDIFSCRVYKALPPRSEVFALLKTYFQTINRIFPVYHEESFMRMLEWQYTQQTCTDVARWASINILLALSYRYRQSHGPRPEKDNEKAWLYFKNAASVLTELSLRRSDLLSIQALLAMAIFLRGNCGLGATVPVVTAAIRSCHSLGLHKRLPRSDLSPVEQEQRKRVFWIAYFFDQTISINVGTAALQDYEDFDVDLPSDDLSEGAAVSEMGRQNCGVRYFRTLCQHTVIRSRIYKELYSTKALTKSISEVRATVNKLSAELEKWKRDNPYISVPSSADAAKDDVELISRIGQRLSYYNSLIIIHRMPFLHEVLVWRGHPSLSGPNVDYKSIYGESYESIQLCVQAARDSLKLINQLPWRDIGYAWSLLDYLFVAVMIVFGSILRETKDPKTQEDLKLLNTAVTYFNTLAPQNGRSKTAKFMATMSSIMERVAKKVVEKEANETKAPNSVSTKQQGSTGPAASTDGDVQIPDIEGFPPVNSSGYVVPGSPSEQCSSSFVPGSIPPADVDTTVDMTGLRPPQDIDQLSTAPSYPWLLPDAYSSFANDRSVPSELWQIPITAEWQLLDQFPELQTNPMSQTMEQGVDANAVPDMGQDLFNQTGWHCYG
ncbi:C6 transcription factor [Rasamsonia emersonii CBS 393.64]|uniref:C6 transcription factor n=1 Tax=Rasamsonia emersonii (strain ATCC 16479 / CBS 393.64 / IMI 116815) TaxID=1408163 RepID=A0A0F4YYX1_RASE3|nr:C6 transcription factor [Rasamsonia emersonii CBS 393.64]KKA22818.1 C6 transcription factor [Rasamsonia emersonii CBS 393.64]